MKQLVIMPGGFHPFHAGHLALYQAAQTAFPGAEVYVAATNDTSARPFPFSVKEKLAQLAGVEPGHFVQVKSPFQAREITQNFDPAATELIFVRSEKDRTKPPQAGGVKKNGELAYLQPRGDQAEPMSQHAYMTYLPTVEFGPGLTSATEIRDAWPTLNERRKTALVMSLYPKTQNNKKLADTVVKMLDTAIGTEPADSKSVAEQLAECEQGQWTVMEQAGGVEIVTSSLFDETLAKKARQAPGLDKKLQNFVSSKQQNPTQPVGAKDKPFPGDGPLGRSPIKLRYAHLTHDIILFYTIEGRDPIRIKLYGVFSHDDIGIGMPKNINKQKSLLNRLHNVSEDYLDEDTSRKN